MRDTISRFLTYFSFLVSFGLFIITFVAAVLGKIEFIMHGCSLLAYPLAGALIGWLALAFAKNEKSILLAKKARNAGLMFAAMFFMLFFVQTPEFVNHEKKLGNSQARSARRHIEIAEEVFCNENKTYSGEMEKLLQKINGGEPAPGVTFVFLHVSASGYTGYTKHVKGGDDVFYFQSDDEK